MLKLPGVAIFAFGVALSLAGGCSGGASRSTPTSSAAASNAHSKGAKVPIYFRNPLDTLKVQDVAHLEEGVLVPLKDGTQLMASMVVPNSASVDSKAPVILIQTPYPNQAELGRELFGRLVREGYAIVVVNSRGTQWSEGEYHWLEGAAADSTDVVNWVTAQPWSNGSVGTIGCSSSGEASIPMLNHPPKGLKAVIAMGAATGVGVIPGFADQGIFYTGGVPQFPWAMWYRGDGYFNHPKLPRNLSQTERTALIHTFDPLSPNWPNQDLSWATHLPSQDVLNSVGAPQTGFNIYIKRKPNDPSWRKQDFLNDGDHASVPVLHVDSWYDSIEIYGTTRLFEYLSNNSKDQYLIIGGGPHCSMGNIEKEHTQVGERPIGDARFDFAGAYVKWFDHWLKNGGQGELPMPRVQYYPLESNKWVSTDSWPPRSTLTEFFLDSDGHANSSGGTGRLTSRPSGGSPDKLENDPLNPVPSHGGGCCLPEAALDQTEIEKRRDVLVYSTEPLASPLDLAGTVKVTLYISTDVFDTDIAIKLVDVYPDGKAFNLSDTIQRLRYRNGIDNESLLKAGETYKIELNQMAIATRLGVGHRVRIEIAGSNFPLYERNMNTGGRNYDESKPVVAHDVIYHDAEHPSRLELPVVSAVSTTR